MTPDLEKDISEAVLAQGGYTRILATKTHGSTSRVYIVERSLPAAGLEGGFRVTRCIKVLKHELLADEGSFARHFLGEATVLLQLNHPHVVKLFGAGILRYTLAGDSIEVPFLEMEAVAEPEDIDDGLKALAKEPLIQAKTFAEAVIGAADALRYMHSKAVFHMDVKPSNIVVDRDNVSRITDFGFARVLDLSGPPAGSIYTSEKYFPQYYKDAGLLVPAPRSQQALFNQNRIPFRLADGVTEEQVINHGTDLHMLCVTVRELLDTVLTEQAREYLDVSLLRDITDTFYICKERNPGGLTLKHASALLAALDGVSRVDASPGSAPDLRHSNHVRTVRLVPKLHVGLTKPVDAIIASHHFQRLRDTIQLGFVDYVYPSATHTRFQHSLGTYHWAREYVLALLQNKGAARFRESFDSKEIQTTLVAALLHDLGQHALAHTFEEEDSDQGFKQIGYLLATGETLTGMQVEVPAASKAAMPLLALAERNGALIDHDLFFFLMGLDIDLEKKDQARLDALRAKHPEWEVLGDILSGPLDVDKLDYLLRDSYSCGLTYHELLDVQRLLDSLTMAEDRSRGACTYSLGTTEKGIIIIETIYFLRKLMISQVYWHKTVRGAHSLVAFAYSTAKGDALDEWHHIMAEVFWLGRSRTISRMVTTLNRSDERDRKMIAQGLANLNDRTNMLPKLGLTLPTTASEVRKKAEQIREAAKKGASSKWLTYQQRVWEKIRSVTTWSHEDGIPWVDLPHHPSTKSRNAFERLRFRDKAGRVGPVTTATLAAIAEQALPREVPEYRIYCTTASGARKIEAAAAPLENLIREIDL